MAYFLGIDGGASKTRCVLGDENVILGRGLAGSSNVIRVGEAAACESLTASILQACADAQIPPSQITQTCVGAAGSDRENVRVPLHQCVGQTVGGVVQVVGDMEVASYAAFGDGPGVIVVAGSGSIAYGKDSSGKPVRAGGWGFAASDEGSGYWIGRRALAASFRWCDERGDSQCELLSDLMKLFGVSSREQLVLKVNGNPSPDFAILAPAVIALANRDDDLAQSVLKAAGEELGALSVVVLKRLFRDSTSAPVAMSGGVFGSSAFLRQVFYNYLLSQFPAAKVSTTVVEPVLGALELARKRAKT